MRIPEYLSFSALSQFESDIDEFILKYLADRRPPREKQGKPASVGSAFDARTKSVLYERYYGPGYMPEKYSYEALFEAQVEEHNRDFAREAGDYVFDCYKISGMFDLLTMILDTAIQEPQFEFTVKREVGGVPLLGKPDGYAKLPNGKRLVLDWKVNGYCSNSAVSPNPGYQLCLDGYKAEKQSRSHNTSHGDFKPVEVLGVGTISESYLEDANEAWASQLAGYGWCLGEPIGSEDVVLVIHQVVAKPLPAARPLLRFSHFASRVRKPFQELLLKRYQKCWTAIQNEHVYPELSKEESVKRFNLMNAQAQSMAENPDDHFNQFVRPTFRGK
ncbi:MAG: hypothetical protein ACTHK7_11950 [Aureliella sp.]